MNAHAFPCEWEDATVITATASLARQLRKQYDTDRRIAGEAVWSSPDILSYSAFLRRCWSDLVYSDASGLPILLSDAQELVVWEEIIRQSRHSDELLRTPETAVQAAQAWKIAHAWELPVDAIAFDAVPDTDAYFAWQRALAQKLKIKRWITEAQLPRVLAERALRCDWQHPRRFRLAGFERATPSHERLWAALRETGCKIDDEPLFAPTEDASVLVCETFADEAHRAAEWARERLEQRPGEMIGVLIPDLSNHREQVERIFDDVLHPGAETRSETPRAFHIAASVPLTDAPIVAGAMLALKRQMRLNLDEAGALLRSPFFRFKAADGANADVELRRKGAITIHPDTSPMLELFGSPRLSEASAKAQLPSRWSITFSRILSHAGWPGTRPLSPIEREALKRWADLLSSFAALDLVLEALTYEQAYSRFEQLASRTAWNPPDDNAPIQVVDAAEASGLRFDAAWIAGMDNARWPDVPRPNPFLPRDLQRRAGIPGSSAPEALAHARESMDRLLSVAPSVVCSFGERDGEEARDASPVIAHFRTVHANGTRNEFLPASLQEWLGDYAPPVSKCEQTGGMSVLKDQSACPFRSFARHRLQAKRLDEPDVGLSPSERGNIVHAVMQKIWERLKTQAALRESSPGELHEIVAACVETALRERCDRTPTRSLSRLRALEQRRLEAQIHEWLKVERARPAFEIVSLEEKEKVEISGLHLDIRADRVDRYLADHSLALIDYKTGFKAPSTKDWEGERPNEPQLPLYAVHRTEPVSSVLFARIHASGKELIGFSDGRETFKKVVVNECSSSWRPTLEALAATYMAGEALVDPKTKKSCEYCELPALCRIADRGASGDEDNDGE